MRIRIVIAFFALSKTFAGQWNAYVGPHFNYTRMVPTPNSHVQGYEGGVTALINYYQKGLFLGLDFEKTRNAGPVVGKHHSRCMLKETYLVSKCGGFFGDSSWMITPYTGFGWDRFIHIKDSKVGGVQYTYDSIFIPYGILFCLNFSFVDLGFQFEYRFDVYNNLLLVFVDLIPSPGRGFRVQLPITQKYGKFALSFVPYFDWNRFGRVRDIELEIPSWSRWNLGLRLLVGCKW